MCMYQCYDQGRSRINLYPTVFLLLQDSSLIKQYQKEILYFMEWSIQTYQNHTSVTAFD